MLQTAKVNATIWPLGKPAPDFIRTPGAIMDGPSSGSPAGPSAGPESGGPPAGPSAAGPSAAGPPEGPADNFTGQRLVKSISIELTLKGKRST